MATINGRLYDETLLSAVFHREISIRMVDETQTDDNLLIFAVFVPKRVVAGRCKMHSFASLPLFKVPSPGQPVLAPNSSYP